MTSDYIKCFQAASVALVELHPDEYEALVLAEAATRGVEFTPCVTCGKPAVHRNAGNQKNGNATKHGGECSLIFDALRLHLPTYRDRHRDVVYRREASYGTDPIKIASAVRQLNGTATTHGRWFVEGSMAWHAAGTAYVSGYPIFDVLDEALRNQIVAAVAEMDAA